MTLAEILEELQKLRKGERLTVELLQAIMSMSPEQQDLAMLGYLLVKMVRKDHHGVRDAVFDRELMEAEEAARLACGQKP